MKRFNRILAALLAVLMLCGAWTAVAEMDVELEIESQMNPEGVDPEVGVNEPKVELVLDDGLQLDAPVFPAISTEMEIEDNLLIEGVEPQGDEPVQPNDGYSEFEIDENGVLVEYRGNGGDVIIPDGVTSIGKMSFWGCDNMTSVTIPDSVTIIGEEAFGSCDRLTSVTIPGSVTSIGRCAFSFCRNLTSVNIQEGVNSIGDNAFSWCESLISITIPGSITNIEKQAFTECTRLTSIMIPGSVTNIEESTFRNCTSLTSVNILDGVTSIGQLAFSSCTSLTSVTMPNSVTSIEMGAFFGCDSLTSFTIPCNVNSIGVAAFLNCDNLDAINVSDENPYFASKEGILYTNNMNTLLQCPGAKTSVTIPDSVTCIEDKALNNCDKLTGITIPDSVASIEFGAFAFCDSLTSVTILARTIRLDKYAFEGSHPSFYIIEESKAIKWAEKHNYHYEILKDGLSEKSFDLLSGLTHQLVLYDAGEEVNDAAWSSSDKSIATVNNGIVMGKEVGRCVISATLSNGKTFTCNVKVYDPAKICTTRLTLNLGETYTLKVTGLFKRTLTWISSNTGVATVKNGRITTKNAGRCIITGQIKDGKKLTCKLTVKDSAAISDTTLSLQTGGTYKLTITGLAKRKVTWASSNTAIATVKNGKVTALKAGKCTITAQIKGGRKLTCRLTVTDIAAAPAE